jgi:hypothetical protein
MAWRVCKILLNAINLLGHLIKDWLFDSRLVEGMTIWWNDHLMKWPFDEMTIWWNGHLMKWPFNELTIWWNDHLMKWTFDEMTIWWNDHLMKWPFDEMTLWWNLEHQALNLLNKLSEGDCPADEGQPGFNLTKLFSSSLMLQSYQPRLLANFYSLV